MIVDLGDQLLGVESGVGRHYLGGADDVSETRSVQHGGELARQAPRELVARLGKDHQQASVPQIPDRVGASKRRPEDLDEPALHAP